MDDFGKVAAQEGEGAADVDDANGLVKAVEYEDIHLEGRRERHHGRGCCGRFMPKRGCARISTHLWS